MSIFIKAGLWIERKLSIKGEFNLTKYITDLIAETPPAPPVALYKVYTALLTQGETDAPVATVLENTIGNIVWSYTAVGLYKATLTSAFIFNKTTLFTSSLQNGSPVHIAFTYDSPDQVYLASFDSLGAPTNDLVNFSSIEIRVYN